MKPEIRDRWCEALESGEYTQGFGSLQSSDGKYCCLGVLTDLYVKDHPDVQWQPGRDPECGLGVPESGPSDVNTASLISQVQEWSGLTGKFPLIAYEGANHSLSAINDNCYEDFNGIAALIRRQL